MRRSWLLAVSANLSTARRYQVVRGLPVSAPSVTCPAALPAGVAGRVPAPVESLPAPDALAETPDQGTIRGRDAIAAYLAEFGAAFPTPRMNRFINTRPAGRPS